MMKGVEPLAVGAAWTLEAALEQAAGGTGLADFGMSIEKRRWKLSSYVDRFGLRVAGSESEPVYDLLSRCRAFAFQSNSDSGHFQDALIHCDSLAPG